MHEGRGFILFYPVLPRSTTVLGTQILVNEWVGAWMHGWINEWIEQQDPKRTENKKLSGPP